MRKVIVISTRYSVISKTKRGSVLASESLTMHDYANKINNYERLQERQEIFSRLTASSIENLDASGVEVFWQVLISDVLPRENLEFLVTRLKKVEEVSDVKTRISIIESGLASQQNKEVIF